MPNRSYQPTLVGLRAFATIARKRHFGNAAAELGVSQPSLSQSLSMLEDGLGVRLVERNTRRVLLTPEGEALLDKATSVLHAAEEFTSAASGVRDPFAQTLRLGLIPTVAPYVLPVMLSGLARAFPEMSLRVTEDQTARLLRALLEGSLDAAVLALPAQTPGIAEISMYREDFVLAVPTGHPLAGGTDIAPAALADLPLLLLDEGHCLRDQALEVCHLAGIRPELGHTRAASLATAVQCVEGGLGVTLIPGTAVTAETAGGGLATATFSNPAPGRRIGLVHRAISGRDDAYRRLAELLTRFVDDAHPVTIETVTSAQPVNSPKG